MRKRLGLAVVLGDLVSSPTIETFAKRILDTTSSGSTLVTLGEPAATPPTLYFVHPAGGQIIAYRTLAAHLPYRVEAFQVTELDIARGDLGVKAMGSRYVEAMKAKHPEGPYHLGGWSSGAIVAFEMARQLDAAASTTSLTAQAGEALGEESRSAQGIDRASSVEKTSPTEAPSAVSKVAVASEGPRRSKQRVRGLLRMLPFSFSPKRQQAATPGTSGAAGTGK